MKDSYENQFQQMADFTLGVCATSCKKIGSCCSIEYCEQAMETGKEQGVNYEPTGNKKLPMLDTTTNTCIVAPHHRPLCTLHQCDIEAFGFIRNDQKATMTYYRMRESLNHAMAAKFNESLK